MSGLTKLGTGLVVVFAVALLALLTELLYVLWRRRRFRRQNPEFPTDSFSSHSKELLHFFCWKTQTRIEPAGAPDVRNIRIIPDAPPEEETNALKWHGLHGPSKILFTIKEEEREDMESDISSSVERKQKTNSMSLEECFGVVVAAGPEVVVTVDLDEATPFSTPCASPFYYTPLASPTREVENDCTYLTGSPEIGMAFVLAREDQQRESPEGGGPS